MDPVIDRLSKLRVGSIWMKSLSGKRYVIVGLAIDTTTSGALVVYKPETSTKWCTRPIGEFLGDQLVPGRDPKEYVSRFVPDADDPHHRK